MIKKIMAAALLLMMLGAFALAEANSFMDDMNNVQGHNMYFAWDGEYAYWIESVTQDWEELPSNICRMRPGDTQPERVLTGRDDFWICDMKNIGGRMILGVKESLNADTIHPYLMDFNGGSLQKIVGRMGSWFIADGAIYNCIDKKLYRMPVDTLHSTNIHTFAGNYDDLIIKQYADGKLYFWANNYSVYELDLTTFVERQIYQGRSSFFVQDGYMYLCDHDKRDGCWRIELASGARIKVSDQEYSFEQGFGGYALAQGMGTDNYYDGAVFDLSKPADNLAKVRAGSYEPYYEFFLGGTLMRYDNDSNTIAYSNRTFTRQSGAQAASPFESAFSESPSASSALIVSTVPANQDAFSGFGDFADFRDPVSTAPPAIPLEEGVRAFARGGTIIMRVRDSWLAGLESEKVPSGASGVYAVDQVQKVLSKLISAEELAAYQTNGYIKATVRKPFIDPAVGTALQMNSRHIGDAWYFAIRPNGGHGTIWDMYLSVSQYDIELSQFRSSMVLPDLSSGGSGLSRRKYTIPVGDMNGLNASYTHGGDGFKVAVYYTEQTYVGVVYEDKGRSTGSARLTIEGAGSIDMSGYMAGEMGIYCFVLTEDEVNAMKSGARVTFSH